MTNRPDLHDRRPEEQINNPQKEAHIDKLERKRRELEAEVERYRQALIEVGDTVASGDDPQKVVARLSLSLSGMEDAGLIPSDLSQDA